MKEDQTRVIESSDRDIKKSWRQVLFRKVQKSPKYAFSVFEGEESHE